jgi:transposase-like protein
MFSVIGADLRMVERKDIGECPCCHGHHVIRYGHEHGRQRWRCADCGRTFSARSSTIAFSSKLRPGQIRDLLRLLSLGATIRCAAEMCRVSNQTALLWRRKLQSAESSGKPVLSGRIVMDETYVSVDSRDIARPSLRGLSRNKRWILVAADGDGGRLAEVGGLGNASRGEMLPILRGRIAPGLVIVHDFHGLNVLPYQLGATVEYTSSKAELNPANALCSQVQRTFAVHLGIVRARIQGYLDAMISFLGSGMKATEYCIERTFSSGITLTRRRVYR